MDNIDRDFWSYIGIYSEIENSSCLRNLYRQTELSLRTVCNVSSVLRKKSFPTKRKFSMS